MLPRGALPTWLAAADWYCQCGVLCVCVGVRAVARARAHACVCVGRWVGEVEWVGVWGLREVSWGGGGGGGLSGV